MNPDAPGLLRTDLALERIVRQESGRVLATLIGLLGDFDRAEEAFQDACTAALATWPTSGVPANPRAWLISTARHKALDHLRREKVLSTKLEAVARETPAHADPVEDLAGDEPWPDERLRLIFTCCHPALAPDAQVALTLRTVCGLSAEEIARAFMTPLPTLQQRIVRAKAKIRAAGIPYRIPEPSELPERLDTVLAVVYLVFNEGYAATTGDALVRRELCGEAIRLGRLLAARLADRHERRAVHGLLALMLLHDARHDAREATDGLPVLLEAQDRSRWDRRKIAEGLWLVEKALNAGPPDAYALEAAIAAVHARAERAEQTDWAQIAELYRVLLRTRPSPVVELNRAVAVAMRDGPLAGLDLIDAILAGGELKEYHLAHSARAEFCRRLGRTADARAAYEQALALTRQAPERRFLESRLAELG